MSYLRDVLKKALTPEMYQAAETALGDTMDEEYVPLDRLNGVVAERNEAKKQLRIKDKSFDDLQSEFDKVAKDDKGESLVKRVAELETELKGKDAEFARQTTEKERLAEITKRIDAKKPKDETAASAIKALLKLDVESVGEDYKGLDTQLAALMKTSAAALFNDDVSGGTGRTGAGEFDMTKPFEKLSSEERIMLNEKNPTLFKSMQDKYLVEKKSLL